MKFPLQSFDMQKKFDESYLVEGKPPDNTVSLPLSASKFPDSGAGHENGLDPEAMLKKMQELVQLDAQGYDMNTKNCSKTVDAILEAGAEQPGLKKVFQNKAFGFFGTPLEVYNNAMEIQHVIYSNRNKSLSLLARLNVNPVERTGGIFNWCFGNKIRKS